jgi:hypothetical protein
MYRDVSKQQVAPQKKQEEFILKTKHG